MTAGKVLKNFFFSWAIIIAYACLLFLLFYPANSPLGKSFAIVVVYMATAYGALVLGIVLLLIRLLKIVKDPTIFLNLFVVNLNISITISALILFLNHQSDFSWFRQALLNLLIGVLMIGDLLMFSFRESG